MMGSSYTETLMINATRSVTNTTRFTNYAHYLSYITFSSFSLAVLLLHNQTQSICATPITFSVRGDLERARNSLGT